MPISEFCKTDVAVVEKNSSVVEAACRMREAHVGDVVVIHHDGGVSRPVGILTDRDIVVGVVALRVPLDSLSVEDVMTPALVTVAKGAGVYETIQLMETYGIRRLPVLDDDGSLYGIVSSNDLLDLLSQEVVALARLSARQKLKEQEIRVT